MGEDGQQTGPVVYGTKQTRDLSQFGSPGAPLRLCPQSEAPRLAPRFLGHEAHAGFKPVPPARRNTSTTGRTWCWRGTGRLGDSETPSCVPKEALRQEVFFAFVSSLAC